MRILSAPYQLFQKRGPERIASLARKSVESLGAHKASEVG